MLRKVLIVAIMCFVAVAAPTAMYAARAEVAGNHQLAIAAATKASTAATKIPTATSKNTKATKTPTPASKSESATKTPTPASKANDKRDLNDPKGAIAKCNDGTYYHRTSHHGACSNHKGVKEWLKP